MRRATVIVLAAVVGATGAGAQGPRADQARTVFRPDRLVRVWADARRVEGRVATLTDAQVSLQHGASVERVALVEVDTIWTAKRAIAKGAVIGAVVGGVGLGLSAVALVYGVCDSVDGCTDNFLPAFLGWGALGAAGGAALGAGVGALLRTWERGWP
ncbi:MAG: hypothetical protein JNJ98_07685 [Gemmatimonadetes bacterium]|nr:hypothetical protein [Gemmatimonadota bacterium]